MIIVIIIALLIALVVLIAILNLEYFNDDPFFIVKTDEEIVVYEYQWYEDLGEEDE